jgi:hypothetical protein
MKVYGSEVKNKKNLLKTKISSLRASAGGVAIQPFRWRHFWIASLRSQ